MVRLGHLNPFRRVLGFHCKSATKWDPTRTLKQGFDLWALFAWREGSQSAPIGTPPQRQICETAQYLAAVYGWGPTSVLKDTLAGTHGMSRERLSWSFMSKRPLLDALPSQRPLCCRYVGVMRRPIRRMVLPGRTYLEAGDFTSLDRAIRQDPLRSKRRRHAAPTRSRQGS